MDDATLRSRRSRRSPAPASPFLRVPFPFSAALLAAALGAGAVSCAGRDYNNGGTSEQLSFAAASPGQNFAVQYTCDCFAESDGSGAPAVSPQRSGEICVGKAEAARFSTDGALRKRLADRLDLCAAPVGCADVMVRSSKAEYGLAREVKVAAGATAAPAGNCDSAVEAGGND